MPIYVPVREPLNWQIYDSIPLLNIEKERGVEIFLTPSTPLGKCLNRTNMMRAGKLDHETHKFLLERISFLVMGAGSAAGSVLEQLEEQLMFTFICRSKPYVEGPAGVVKLAEPKLQIYGEDDWHARVRLESWIHVPESVKVSPMLYVILQGELMRPIQ